MCLRGSPVGRRLRPLKTRHGEGGGGPRKSHPNNAKQGAVATTVGSLGQRGRIAKSADRRHQSQLSVPPSAEFSHPCVWKHGPTHDDSECLAWLGFLP